MLTPEKSGPRKNTASNPKTPVEPSATYDKDREAENMPIDLAIQQERLGGLVSEYRYSLTAGGKPADFFVFNVDRVDDESFTIIGLVNSESSLRQDEFEFSNRRNLTGRKFGLRNYYSLGSGLRIETSDGMQIPEVIKEYYYYDKNGKSLRIDKDGKPQKMLPEHFKKAGVIQASIEQKLKAALGK